MEQQKQSAVLVEAGRGETFSMAGGSYRIIVSGSETNGEYATIEMTVPPGGGPGPHAHAGFHETFYVLEGEVEIRTEDGRYTATAGSYAAIPKGGIVHGFKNQTDKVARLLCTVVPAGLENFFKEVAAVTAPVPGTPTQAPDMAKLNAIAGKYGQVLYPPDYLD
ncbi:cupin domain-containing protein [Dyadobacter sandarakinus]|uniref:Cupin domain-containing protein n=1 Tax=Dyadobacter sandarakinus TaxID=2747268 RepID=A0ABX7I337_9BACT|nr:cupin domain-containing protein [Dyadobacter sandarakinus]QRR00239.1 cupin domain-containing protein [Dyadobacter sandarakinus]